MEASDWFIFIVAIAGLGGWVSFILIRNLGGEPVGAIRVWEQDMGGRRRLPIGVRRIVYGAQGYRQVQLVVGAFWYPYFTARLNQVEAARGAEILERAAEAAEQ
jgi:hypothetical protein